MTKNIYHNRDIKVYICSLLNAPDTLEAADQSTVRRVAPGRPCQRAREASRRHHRHDLRRDSAASTSGLFPAPFAYVAYLAYFA